MTRFPVDLDDDTNLPNPVGFKQDGTAPNGTFVAAAVHSTLLRVLQLGSQAVQRKLGRGNTAPTADRVLVGTGPGLSEWRALIAVAITSLGVGPGLPGQALVVAPAGQSLVFNDGFATDADLAAHEADTTAVHGIANTASLVLTGDARLADQRVPTDGSVTDAKIAAAAAIAESKLALASDGLAAVPTRRTLGTTATSAAAGNDARLADARAPSGPATGDLAGTYPGPTHRLLSVTDAHVAAANKDGTALTASLRTLGTSALQAVPGTHTGETGAGKHVLLRPAIADLPSAVSNPPTQAEVQAVVSKVNAILAALRTGGELTP